MPTSSTIFKACVEAIRASRLITREGVKDKEFHFQNWFGERLEELKLAYDEPGRNTYPDYRLVQEPSGYELKGLAYPGRDATYDSNSQVPCGEHHSRRVYYVFGRYPKSPDGDSYPVLDLVICHGSFLNADSSYVHKNRSFRGFGSYGDVLVRDRKMYVVPTPFALALGTAHHRTLILPSNEAVSDDLVRVGQLTRIESPELVCAYKFDLTTNELATERRPNPNAGKAHQFTAYRLAGDPTAPVELRDAAEVMAELDVEAEDEENVG